MRDRPWSELAVVPAVILLALTGLGGVHAASFAEPSTVFYGKVTGTGSAQPFLVTEGELTWTIRRADGSDLALRAPLFPLHGGEFSYRLDVPHTVLGAELQADDAAKGIPLPRVAQSHSHLSIAVDGMAARIAGASGTLFDADQARRAATYRLDLEVDLEAPDSDGDGLPDWWEEANGLDPEDPRMPPAIPTPMGATTWASFWQDRIRSATARSRNCSPRRCSPMRTEPPECCSK